MEMQLLIAPGVTAELSLDRSGDRTRARELHQQTNDLAGAVDIVEQLEPTTYAASPLAELYLQLDRYADVVTLTDGIANGDDATALLCVFRGVALREQHFLDMARTVVQGGAQVEEARSGRASPRAARRARTYEAEGKRALARKDLESIMAEDSAYDGLADALAELGES